VRAASRDYSARPTNWRRAESASAEARQRLDEIDQLLAKAVEAERVARDARDRDAADLGLTAWKESSALAKPATSH
jgi:hypothetical protein